MSNVTIEGLDMFDLINILNTKNKKWQAICLQEVEEILDKNSEEYRLVRKAILDSMNTYTRSTFRVLFGNIEIDTSYRRK